MASGKLFSNPRSSRCIAVEAIIQIKNLDVEIVRVEDYGAGAPSDYLKVNPLGKVPAFVREDGHILTESVAIAIYLNSLKEKSTLLGQNDWEYASILRWMTFVNSDLLTPMGEWASQALGKVPYHKPTQDRAMQTFSKNVAILEEHLTHNTFLVGERQTLADIFCASCMNRGFRLLFLDQTWREAHPGVSRWFTTLRNHPAIVKVAGPPEMIETAIPAVPPKTEKTKPEKQKALQPKAAPSAKPKAAEEDEDEPAPEPKPKHVLEALGRPEFVLDDWKRKYSNEDVRTIAMPWFWANMKFDEYSIWSLDYLYNDELRLTFMSSNLIGGFFNRLEASRKYLFGCMSVYGENNNSIIRGAFLVRGQEALPAFDVAPDCDSYTYRKLDHNDPKDRAYLEDMWSMDKPTTFNGTEYPWADGKSFK